MYHGRHHHHPAVTPQLVSIIHIQYYNIICTYYIVYTLRINIQVKINERLRTKTPLDLRAGSQHVTINDDEPSEKLREHSTGNYKVTQATQYGS